MSVAQNRVLIAERPAAVTGGVTIATLPVLLALIALFAAGVALSAPLATAVYALLLFGVWHNIAEIRYIAQRYTGRLLTDRVFVLLLAFIATIAATRLAQIGLLLDGTSARQLEIVLMYSLLGVGLWLGRGQLRGRGWIVAGLALAAIASLSWSGWHFLVLTHLHNVLPWIFLVQAVPRDRSDIRRALGWIGAAVFLLIPAGILTGMLGDPGSLSLGSGLGGQWGDFSRALILPAWTGTPLAARLLTCFAYLQLIHFALWIAVLPRLLASDDAAKPITTAGRVAADPRIALLGVVLVLAGAALFWTDFQATRSLYPVFATWHAYLEFPLLVLLLSAPVADSAVATAQS